jgi:2-polyprenyl-3-methyl-5-hydroxy-6-metoxy-1,4-benzoquinol methylase
MGIAWRFFAPAGFGARLHQAVRCMLSPFGPLIELLPETGSLLDVGCGHGLFLRLARAARPALRMTGIDYAADKIEAARSAFASLDGAAPALAVTDVRDLPPASFDVVTSIDVFYLIPRAEWGGVLRRIHECLVPGGTLVFKELDRTRRLRFRLIELEEWLAVRVLKWTQGGLRHWPPPDEVRSELTAAGFAVERVVPHPGYLAPHQSWIARKPGG